MSGDCTPLRYSVPRSAMTPQAMTSPRKMRVTARAAPLLTGGTQRTPVCVDNNGDVIDRPVSRLQRSIKTVATKSHESCNFLRSDEVLRVESGHTEYVCRYMCMHLHACTFVHTFVFRTFEGIYPVAPRHLQDPFHGP